MKFQETLIQGAYVIEPERLEDERGFFARTWCQQELEQQGLETGISQCNLSFNHRSGTLRGMHYQAAPHGETKIVRCTRGAIFDVIVDLRPDSPSYLRWFGIELTAENRLMLYIPPSIAHGFLTRADSTEVFYQMSVPFHPASARGVRWDDPALGIEWPQLPAVISERDRLYPDFDVPSVS
ncbi:MULTISPECIES: dTDP-4-dehydrorhamnose 3,5-epimerase [unclassified Schlesneria]|uniref:dTDP-4-dehydrorhamnose 3,5-epimerase n=1 Tax=Schlesneria TaxID=656899 RepID=UPI002F16AD95